MKSYKKNLSFEPVANANNACVAEVLPLLFDPTKIEMSEASLMRTSLRRL